MQPGKQNPVYNGIHGDEVISMQYNELSKEKGRDEPRQTWKQVPKEKVGMNLNSPINRFPGKRLG